MAKCKHDVWLGHNCSACDAEDTKAALIESVKTSNGKVEPKNSIKESIHYKHDVEVYVPCFEIKPSNENESPTFKYSMSDATSDPQMAASMNPDYILVLKGVFDAKTQPFDYEVLKHNKKVE